MKYLQQFTVILGFSFGGELCRRLLPLPIPASIYGMLLLFAALLLRLVRVEQVSDTGNYLVSIMAVMFICPAVGLLTCWDTVAPALLPVGCIIVVSLVVTFLASGRITQYFIRRQEGKEHE